MLIDPDQLPRLAVPFMNEDHAEEARLLNAAADQAEAFGAGRSSADQVAAALESLYQHTRMHFTREETAMVEASFPAYSFHQAEHVRILGELGEAERRFREAKEAAPLLSYLGSLPPWLGKHIQSMDAVTARYVAEWGG
jgi:hemerythrin